MSRGAPDLLSFALNRVSWCKKQQLMQSLASLQTTVSHSKSQRKSASVHEASHAIAARAVVFQTSSASVLVRLSFEEGADRARLLFFPSSHKMCFWRAGTGSSETVFSLSFLFPFFIYIFLQLPSSTEGRQRPLFISF